MADVISEHNVKLSFSRRIQKAQKAWHILNEPMLKHRHKMFMAWASGYYEDKANPFHTINLIGRGVDTVVPFLVEGNPRFLVETPVNNYRPYAYITQLAINYYLKRLDIAEKALIPAALNSMFGAGIVRTCLTHSGNIRLEEGGELKAGQPSVTVIDDANYIGDPSAKRRVDFRLEGDVYRLPTTYARDFFAGKDKFGNEIADYIKPDGKLIQEYSPEDIAKSNYDRVKFGIMDQTTFMDVFLPEENTIITLMPEGKKAKILREVEWKGPDGGPYDYLGYKFISESPIPLPPAWAWHDLDTTMNSVFDKSREQAENQKKVLAYEDVAEEDAKRVVNTPNMGSVRVNNISSLKEISFGGMDNANLEWMQFAEAEFTKQGGNPDILGGRGAQAKTLGQEQLIFNNATRIIRSFVNRFDNFTSSIVKKFAWDFWHNPLSYTPVLREIPGYGRMPAVFSSSDTVGKFDDFMYNLVPFSMQRESPETKYQKMMQYSLQWIIPTYQMAQSQGAQIDIPLLSRIMAEYAGFENFNQFYKTAVPHELENVPFTMMPMSNSPGQGNDTFGATLGSRTANMQQQQTRAGGQSSPEHFPGQRSTGGV